MNSLLFPLEIIFLFIAYGLFAYRGFLRLNKVCENAWMKMRLVLVKRHDLISHFLNSQVSSNDVAITKLGEVLKKAMSSKDMREQVILESDLSEIMASIDVSEDHNDLKSFCENLKSIEQQAFQEEAYFNAVVQDYSLRSTSFPSKLIAQKFGFVAPHIYKSSDSFSKELSC